MAVKVPVKVDFFHRQNRQKEAAAIVAGQKALPLVVVVTVHIHTHTITGKGRHHPKN